MTAPRDGATQGWTGDGCSAAQHRACTIVVLRLQGAYPLPHGTWICWRSLTSSVRAAVVCKPAMQHPVRNDTRSVSQRSVLRPGESPPRSCLLCPCSRRDGRDRCDNPAHAGHGLDQPVADIRVLRPVNILLVRHLCVVVLCAQLVVVRVLSASFEKSAESSRPESELPLRSCTLVILY